MKKATIWTVAIVMGLSFLVLLFMQIKYIEEMVHMKKEQFDESVTKALSQAARNLELNETLRYLEKDVNATERRAFKQDSVGTRSGEMDGTVQHSHQYSVVDKNGTMYSSFELKTITMKPSSMPIRFHSRMISAISDLRPSEKAMFVGLPPAGIM